MCRLYPYLPIPEDMALRYAHGRRDPDYGPGVVGWGCRMRWQCGRGVAKPLGTDPRCALCTTPPTAWYGNRHRASAGGDDFAFEAQERALNAKSETGPAGSAPRSLRKWADQDSNLGPRDYEWCWKISRTVALALGRAVESSWFGTYLPSWGHGSGHNCRVGQPHHMLGENPSAPAPAAATAALGERRESRERMPPRI